MSSMFTVPAMPELIRSAWGLILTSMTLNQLAGYWLSSTSRLFEVLGWMLPSTSVTSKSALRPWIRSCCARPLYSCTARPGTRDSASAILVPGSSPISCEEITSSIVSEFFWSAIEFSRLLTKPLITTSCSTFSFATSFLFFFPA